MSIRRSRLSLCLVRRSESPKSPICSRTRSAVGEDNNLTGSECSTPMSTRKSRKSFKDDSSRPTGYDYSPIPMSQDANNLVSGVSWAWNSPKRPMANDYKAPTKPLTSNNQISYKDTESSRSYKKRPSSRLTGFQRFQSELKLLQESDELIGDSLELKTTLSCASVKVIPPTSPPPSSDENNSLLKKTAKKKPSAKKQKRELSFKPQTKSYASDSFNNSYFDNLLLQASEAMEWDKPTSDTSEDKETLSCTTMPLIPPTLPTAFPNGVVQNITSKGTQKPNSHVHKASHISGHSDSFNSSELDDLLLQASQAVETQFDANMKLSKRPDRIPVTDQKQQYIVKRCFSKRKTTNNFNSTSDDSRPDANFDLIIQQLAVPKVQEKQSDEYVRKSKPLTRHRLMPESPSNKIVSSSKDNGKWKNDEQYPVSIYNSSSGSVTFVPRGNDKIVVPSTSCGVSSGASTPASSGKCSKEQIEQKRQEALKRQASRLKKLMQGNHSQSETMLLESKPK